MPGPYPSMWGEGTVVETERHDRPYVLHPTHVWEKLWENSWALLLRLQCLYAWQALAPTPSVSRGPTLSLLGSNLPVGWEVGLGDQALPSRPSP